MESGNSQGFLKGTTGGRGFGELSGVGAEDDWGPWNRGTLKGWYRGRLGAVESGNSQGLLQGTTGAVESENSQGLLQGTTGDRGFGELSGVFAGDDWGPWSQGPLRGG
jgi:hypothetical protein